MKRWIRTLPAKIICFILCITGALVTVASVNGVQYLNNQLCYTRTKEYQMQHNLYEEFRQDACGIIDLESRIRNFNVDSTEYSAKNTNLRFQVLNADGEVVARNTENYNDKESHTWEFVRYFAIKPTDNGFDGFELLDYSGTETMPEQGAVYIVQGYLEEGLPKTDDYAVTAFTYNVAYAVRYAIYPIGLLALALMITCFVILMCTSARRPASETLHPGLLNAVPVDLLLVAMGFLYIAILSLFETLGYTVFLAPFGGDATPVADFILESILIIILFNFILGFCMSVAARVKQKSLLKNTVIWRCCHFLWRMLKWLGRLFVKIPLVWKTALIVVGICIVELIGLVGVWYASDLIGFWFIEKIILIPVILYIALMLRKLQKGGAALAKGDFNYKVNTNGLVWDFKQHGENLNSLAGSMHIAVEEGLKSERMKTELITNVSHDIKTPLTSIINYANLIGEEACDSAQHKEYAEVLVRKSVHLKRLLDDLVEVSKASSGNLDVVLEPCDAGVLLTQVAGEFEQRCQEAGLELITRQPEDTVLIMADSRRIWRVFENLMSNACKYSLAGSRVYLQLEQVGEEAIFTFRNTSRTVLHISPAELMERFVRGDVSRSTEGNGLGLSIANSLTELQKGKMDITIDGDLFKVTVRFPVVGDTAG